MKRSPEYHKSFTLLYMAIEKNETKQKKIQIIINTLLKMVLGKTAF